MNRKLAVDSVVFEKDQVLRVSAIRPAISQIVLQGASGEEFFLNTDEFQQRIAAGQYRRSYGPYEKVAGAKPVRHLTQTERSALDQRLAILDYVEKERREGYSLRETINKLRDYCADNNLPFPSERTVQRWQKTSSLSTSPDQLAPNFHCRGNKRAMNSADDFDFEETIVDEIMLSYFMSDKYSLKAVTESVNHQCHLRAARRNVEFRGISRRSVCRRIRAFEHSLIGKGRVSKATLNQEMRVAVKKLFVERPYERVEVDATPLDIFCRDEAGNCIGKATCYAGIDAATGAIVMLKCGIEKPSQDFVLSALEFCFSPKGEEFTKRYQLRQPWLAPAAIETIVLDNAQEHHGGLVLNALRYLNTTIDYPMAGKPQAKPYIERFFGTVKTRLINMLPGCTKSQSTFEKNRIERAMSEQLLTVQELEAQIIRWISDVYMRTPIRRLERRFGDGCSPARAMELLKQQHIIIPPPDPEEFRNACIRYHVREVTLSREGVSLESMGYNSDELARLYQRRGEKTKVKVRLNPLDCRSVFVEDPDDVTVLIQAFERLGGMPHISFDEARAIRRKSYKSDAQLSSTDYQIAQEEDRLENREKMSSGKMRDRNQAARYMARESKKLENQRQEKSAPATERAAPTKLEPLSAAPRRSKAKLKPEE